MYFIRLVVIFLWWNVLRESDHVQVVTWRGTFEATVVTICRVLPSNLFFWQVSLKNQNHRTVIIKIHKFLSLNRACHIHHGVFIVAVFTLGGMVTWYKPKVIFYWCLFVFVILFLFVFFSVDLGRNALSLQIPILPIRLDSVEFVIWITCNPTISRAGGIQA